jgi:hypothetical protein
MQDFVLSDDVVRRFWSKVDKSGKNGCWNWTGWKNVEGYGRFDICELKPLATHIALFLDGRPRPSPKHLALHGDHCTPACCNPDHLRWGSGKENADDRDRLGRRKRVPRGEASPNARITEDDVRRIRSSPLSQYQLAAELGISQVMVGKIRNRKAWAHVP